MADLREIIQDCDHSIITMKREKIERIIQLSNDKKFDEDDLQRYTLVHHDKWLVWDEVTEAWVVYQHKRGARKTTRVIETTDEEVAVKVLLEED